MKKLMKAFQLDRAVPKVDNRSERWESKKGTWAMIWEKCLPFSKHEEVCDWSLNFLDFFALTRGMQCSCQIRPPPRA